MKKYYKYELSIGIVTLISFVLLIPFIFVIPLLFNNIDVDDKFFISFILFYILYFLYMALHELIHGIGYFLSGTKKENITYGMALEKGICYCLTKTPINKKGILFSITLPFITIGVITLIISIIFKLPMLGLLSIFNISGCSGDLVMFFFFLTKEKDIMYKEIDDPTKFVIISNNELKSTKWLGLKLLESGDYAEDKFKTTDHKRVVISTFSKIFMIISLIICILMLGFYL